MSASITHGIAVRQADAFQRVAGVGAAIGGALYFVAGLRFAFDNARYDTLSTALALLWCLGCLAALAGIARLSVAGNGWLGRAALIAAFAGVSLVMLAWLIGFDDPAGVEDGALIIVARVATMLGFLALGVAFIRARRWTGWRRLTPFLYPLAAVLGGVSWGVADIELTVALIGLAWVAIGTIIATTDTVNPRDAATGA